MRLLFVSNLFPSRDAPVRGLDNAHLLEHLRPHFDALRAVAVRPALFPGRAPPAPRDQDRWLKPVFCASRYVPKIGSRWNHRLMARALRPVLAGVRATFPFDGVLGSWLYPDGCALAQLARESGFPLWLICQGSDAHRYLEVAVRRRLIVAACNGSAGVVTRSADLARRLEEAGVAASKLHPIYNGVDTSVFHPPAPGLEAGGTAGQAEGEGEGEGALREFGMDADARYVLFVGNLLPVKNPLMLVQAFAGALGDAALAGTEARLAMVGEGPLRGALQREAARLGIGARVHLLGRRRPREIADLMRAARCLALSSHNEGVPNVVLEAIASGLPVVATDVGGIREVVDAPLRGELTAPGDPQALASALARALSRPPGEVRERRAQIAAGAGALRWPEAAARYAKLISR